jgi:hypothetical protein
MRTWVVLELDHKDRGLLLVAVDDLCRCKSTSKSPWMFKVSDCTLPATALETIVNVLQQSRNAASAGLSKRTFTSVS